MSVIARVPAKHASRQLSNARVQHEYNTWHMAHMTLTCIGKAGKVRRGARGGRGRRGSLEEVLAHLHTVGQSGRAQGNRDEFTGVERRG